MYLDAKRIEAMHCVVFDQGDRSGRSKPKHSIGAVPGTYNIRITNREDWSNGDWRLENVELSVKSTQELIQHLQACIDRKKENCKQLRDFRSGKTL